MIKLQLRLPCPGVGNRAGEVPSLPSVLVLHCWLLVLVFWYVCVQWCAHKEKDTQLWLKMLWISSFRKRSTYKPLRTERTLHTFSEGSLVFTSAGLAQPCSGGQVPCSARRRGGGQREDERLPLVCRREILQEHELPGPYFNYYITTNPLFSFQI